MTFVIVYKMLSSIQAANCAVPGSLIPMPEVSWLLDCDVYRFFWLGITLTTVCLHVGLYLLLCYLSGWAAAVVCHIFLGQTLVCFGLFFLRLTTFCIAFFFSHQPVHLFTLPIPYLTLPASPYTYLFYNYCTPATTVLYYHSIIFFCSLYFILYVYCFLFFFLLLLHYFVMFWIFIFIFYFYSRISRTHPHCVGTQLE